jgi:hypothetical protein
MVSNQSGDADAHLDTHMSDGDKNAKKCLAFEERQGRILLL